MMKYTKVLKYMQDHGGRIEIDSVDPELKTILGTYKLVGAMSAIRRLAKLEVQTIRNGRKAVAYALVATTPIQTAPVTDTTTADDYAV